MIARIGPVILVPSYPVACQVVVIAQRCSWSIAATSSDVVEIVAILFVGRFGVS